jgi:hypothetical protein
MAYAGTERPPRARLRKVLSLKDMTMMMTLQRYANSEFVTNALYRHKDK